MDTIILYYKNTVIATLTCPHIHITSTYCVCVERKVHFPAQKSSVITYDKGGLENKEVLKRLNAVPEALSSLLHSIIYMLSQHEVIFMILLLNYAY